MRVLSIRHSKAPLELVTENTKNEDVWPLYDALLVAVEARLSVVPYNCVDLFTLFPNVICQ